MNDQCRNPNDQHRGSSGSFSSFAIRHFAFIREFGFRHSFVILSLVFFHFSCGKPIAPATNPVSPTIASLVPAATDLIVGMGAKDRLVAISSVVDKDRADVGNLPKAGDYETIDWELLRSLHPSILVTEISPDRQSPGFKANAAELNITPINVKIETLDDIFGALDFLGNAMKTPDLAAAAATKMHQRLDAVRDRSAGQKSISTLLVIDSNADAVVGPGTYLDDLLTIAGGENAAKSLQQHWPQIDREMLLSLKPDAIIELLPDASPQEREKADATWKQYPQIPAVAAGRVYPIYDSYALLPGWHVTDLAERFSKCLHPEK
jgi:iron complex transport system substrate-binding protein